MLRGYCFCAVVILCTLLQTSVCQKWWYEMLNETSKPWAPPPLDKATFTIDSEDEDYCECVYYYQCDPNTRRIIATGGGLVGWRVDVPKPQEGNSPRCGEVGKVCCKPPLPEAEGPKREVSSVAPLLPSEEDEELAGNDPDSEGPLRCGQRRPFVDYRVSGPQDDTDTKFGEFPWMVMIQQVEREGPVLRIFRCGGSLIHPSVVMTAAHCLQGSKAEDLEVRAGEWNTNSDDEPMPHQDVAIESIMIHPLFNESHPQHDIALLLLRDQVTLSDSVNQICLPDADIDYDELKCFGTGWGLDKGDKSGKPQKTLRKANLPLIPKNECQTMLRKTRLGRYFKLHKSFLCAGGEGDVDMCIGDGGGPLSCMQGGKFIQVGITSWGIGCGVKNVPGVYTDVAVHHEWIEDAIDNWLQG